MKRIGGAASAAETRRIETYRWFFFISLFQVVFFFVIPALGFPIDRVPYVLAIAALTLGLPVAVFFLIVSVYGVFIDTDRRSLYVLMVVIMAVWFLWAAVTWSHIEHMRYLLN